MAERGKELSFRRKSRESPGGEGRLNQKGGNFGKPPIVESGLGLPCEKKVNVGST